MMSENVNQIASAIAVAKEAFRPELVHVGEVGAEALQVLAWPAGMNVRSAEEFLAPLRPNPRARVGTSKHQNIESFIAHANRFSDGDSVLFADADMSQPSLTAIYDYHQALNAPVAEGGEKTRSAAEALPRFGRHRSVYHFPVSTEWAAWLAQNGEPMDQRGFAEFLEDRIGDVLPPPDEGDATAARLLDFARSVSGSFATPARLMELSRGLAVRIDERVKAASNLSTGEGEIQWEQSHNDAAGQPLRVPSLFLIGIPVFKGGIVYRLCVRLRYRASGGKVTWFYHIYQFERAFEDAFNEACGRAKTETALPLFVGTPEA